MKYFLLVLFSFCIFSLPTDFTLAAEPFPYQPITNFPIPASSGVNNLDNLTLDEAIKIIYALSVSIAALLAVVKIIYAGVQYMLTDVITNKGKAIADIQGALFGLLIVLGAAFILNQINPQLSDVNVLKEVTKFKSTQGVNQAAVQRTPQSNSVPTLTAENAKIGLLDPYPLDGISAGRILFSYRCYWSGGTMTLLEGPDKVRRYHCIANEDLE